MKNDLLILGFALAFIAGASAFTPVMAQSIDDGPYDYDAAARADDDLSVDDEAVDDDDDFDAAVDEDDTDDTAATADASEESDGEDRCAAMFRSFDPNSGTYTTYEGDRLPCPYL